MLSGGVVIGFEFGHLLAFLPSYGGLVQLGELIEFFLVNWFHGLSGKTFVTWALIPFVFVVFFN
jgi:hypothetical protein